MARLSGKAGVMYDATAVAAIDGIKSWTLDYTYDALESTGFDSSAHRKYIPGLDGWRGSFEGYKEAAPKTIGTEINVELKESATATQKFTGAAIITGLHANTPVDGLVTYGYDFQGTGALVIPTT